ncbi:peptidoglycan-binding protein [Streptomyces sp. NPDC048187]|uniref:peptidoglycan-binding domain-containing protein n=1 Tax=Streptomyces sp. NPDC048187 TaxID=3365509 RepID=UPI0037232153
MSAPHVPQPSRQPGDDTDDIALVRPYLSHPRRTGTPGASPLPKEHQSEESPTSAPHLPQPADVRAAGRTLTAPARPRSRRRRPVGNRPRRCRKAAAWLTLTAAAGGTLWMALPSEPSTPPVTPVRPPATGAALPTAAGRPSATAPAAPATTGPSQETDTATSGPPRPAGTGQGNTPTRSGPAAPNSQKPGGQRNPAPRAPARSGGPDTPAGPGELGPGDRGAAVAHLQVLLFDQGKTYVSTTGVYDSATVRAVGEIQREYGITGDRPGYYGPATRAALEPG